MADQGSAPAASDSRKGNDTSHHRQQNTKQKKREKAGKPKRTASIKKPKPVLALTPGLQRGLDSVMRPLVKHTLYTRPQ